MKNLETLTEQLLVEQRRMNMQMYELIELVRSHPGFNSSADWGENYADVGKPRV